MVYCNKLQQHRQQFAAVVNIIFEVATMSVEITSTKGVNRDTVCCLVVPNSLLYNWYVTRTGDSTFFSQNLNKSIVGKSLMLNSSPKFEERVRIQGIYSKVQRGENQRKRDKIKAQSTTVYVYTDEVVRPSDIYEEVQELRYTNINIVI